MVVIQTASRSQAQKVAFACADQSSNNQHVLDLRKRLVNLAQHVVASLAGGVRLEGGNLAFPSCRVMVGISVKLSAKCLPAVPRFGSIAP